jgi:hypothetical protein
LPSRVSPDAACGGGLPRQVGTRPSPTEVQQVRLPPATARYAGAPGAAAGGARCSAYLTARGGACRGGRRPPRQASARDQPDAAPSTATHDNPPSGRARRRRRPASARGPGAARSACGPGAGRSTRGAGARRPRTLRYLRRPGPRPRRFSPRPTRCRTFHRHPRQPATRARRRTAGAKQAPPGPTAWHHLPGTACHHHLPPPDTATATTHPQPTPDPSPHPSPPRTKTQPEQQS